MRRNRYAGAILCGVVLGLVLSLGNAPAQAAPTTDTALREWVARDGWLRVQVDLRLPGDPALPRDAAQEALWQADLDQTAQDLLSALPAGSADTPLRAAGASVLTLRADTAGLDELLLSPWVAAVAAAGNANMQRIAAGYDHSLALKPDGTLWAWGHNGYGQLGDGTTTDRLAPVNVLTGVAAVAAGSSHNLVLKPDGTLWAWGSNWIGQLGDGTATNRLTPVQVQVLTGVAAVAAGDYHTMALKPDGTLWAWGYNWIGQLGDGTVTSRDAPVQVLTGVAAVAGGGKHTLALKTDGTLWAWGGNWDGQLGDGTTTERYAPVQVLTGVAVVATGSSHTLALKTDGTLWAWGDNWVGQLGDGTTTNRLTPVQVQVLTGVAAVAAGAYHTLALKTDGTLWAWGYNAYGQLGDGTYLNRSAPVQVLTGVAAVAAGDYHTLAIKPDGTLWAWGGNWHGQLGDGTTTQRQSPVHVPGFDPLPNFAVTKVLLTPTGPTVNGTFNAEVTVTNQGTVAGTPGTLQVWADQATAQACAALGDQYTTLPSLAAGASYTVTVSGLLAGAAGTKTLRAFVDSECLTAETDETNNQSTTSYEVMPPPDFAVTEVALVPSVPGANGIFTATVTVTNQGGTAGTPGTLQVWADQPNTPACAAVGDQSVTLPSLAVGEIYTATVSGLPAGAAGTKTLRVFVDSQCLTAEPNEADNQFTLGYTVGSAVGSADAMRRIAAGYAHSLAIKSDGSLWVWGNNLSGQLGDGTTTKRPSPVQVLTGVTAVSAEAFYSLALKSDSSLWAWGNDGYGFNSHTSPVQVLTGVNAIAAGGTFAGSGPRHSLALKADGSLWAWGDNLYGQLGDGTISSRGTPVQTQVWNGVSYAPLTGVAAIAGGAEHSLALKSDGSLWVWGKNWRGQIGDGTQLTDRRSPVQIMTGVAAMAAGAAHSLALKTDGSLWAWGDNSSGQLGDGSLTIRLSPVQVMTGVVAVAAGSAYSMAIKTDGSLWAWGDNAKGQFGDGTLAGGARPRQVLTGVAAVAAGHLHTLVLKTDGSLWTFGWNADGQLGDGTVTDRLSPVLISGFAPIVAPDFVVTQIAPSPSTPSANGTFAATVTVTNRGTVAATPGTLQVWSDAPAALGCTAVGDGSATLTSLAAGASRVVTISGLPAGAAGTKTLRAFVDSECLTIEADDTNNQGVSTYTVAPLPPDFVVTGIVLTPDSPSVNDTFSAAVTVKNQGAGSGMPGTLQVWANQSAVQDCGAAGDQAITLAALAAGASQTVTFAGLPAGAAGTKTLRAFVDSQCQSAESDDTNNQSTSSYAVIVPVPNFAVTGMVLTPRSPDGHGTLSATVTVTNRGTGAGTPGTLRVWADQASLAGCGAVGDQSATVPNLAAGASQTVTLTGLPAGAAGAKTLRAFVDSECLTTESDEADNQATRAYLVSDPQMRRLAGGAGHNLAIEPGGSLWAWGYNRYGQLGDGTTTDRLTPVLVLTSVAAVAAGELHTLAVKTDGTLWAWGSNQYGQLGDGTTTDRLAPVQVLAGVASVAAGSAHNLALKTDGSLWAWGRNAAGQLGDSTNTDRWRPIQILTGVSAVAAGSGHTLAIMTDGTLRAAGWNQYCQLGRGNTVDTRYLEPVLTDVAAVAAGQAFTLAIKTDGSLWTWGYNADGQLGDGTTALRCLPVQVMTGVAAAAAGYDYTLAIKSDGSLWAWGRNAYGQLGDGTTTDRLTSVKVLTDVAAVSAGASHTLARKTDGSLWAWGANSVGQVGDGTLTDRLSPVPIRGVDYTLTLNLAGTGAGTLGGGGSYPANTTVAPTATPATGSTFSGWIPATCGSAFVLTANTTCTATFTLNSYTIAASASPAAGGTVSCTVNPVDYDGSSTCTATPAAGYTFSAWSGDCSGESCVLNNVTAAKAVTATFTLNSYTIAVSASPAAGGTVSCTVNPVDYGGSSTCTATAAAGYTFSAWSGDCTGATCALSNVTAVKAVTATFTLNSYAITASPTAGGTASCMPNPVDHGGSSTCTATANPGYLFAGWRGDCLGQVRSTCTLNNITAAKTVTATYVEMGSALPSRGGWRTVLGQ
ncbi:CARDB domain-containing protein [uncultured Thiodictyon sp.]|uniref:RCC1 domain-containing protein n=1 Tax=uncultured Thiodictyon sp. TaxID=1846217 RepID=UPI0025FB72A8|nr:CARDB domain-containing protein [uncultured Thiodictyon sp.]